MTGQAGRLVGAGRLRSGGAVLALRGGPVRPPLAARRWPWALLAGGLAALAGASAVLIFRRLIGTDAPDAQEPTHLVAVVDRPAGR